jgi:hypothetical protein
MTQDQFWNILKEFVIFHPADAERPCMQLQTWGLLRNLEANLNDAGLGMTIRDKGKPTFFSRRWAESGYNPNAIRADGPYLVANLIDMASTHGNRNSRTDYVTFDLAVLDNLIDPKVRATACAGRNEIEIFQDAWTILQQVFAYLKGIVHATVTPLVGADYVQVTSLSRLEYLLSESLITGYEVDFVETNSIQGNFKDMKKTVKGLPWRGGIGALHGMYVSDLTMKFDECPEPIELDFPAYERVVNEQERCC